MAHTGQERVKETLGGWHGMASQMEPQSARAQFLEETARVDGFIQCWTLLWMSF